MCSFLFPYSSTLKCLYCLSGSLGSECRSPFPSYSSLESTVHSAHSPPLCISTVPLRLLQNRGLGSCYIWPGSIVWPSWAALLSKVSLYVFVLADINWTLTFSHKHPMSFVMFTSPPLLFPIPPDIGPLFLQIGPIHFHGFVLYLRLDSTNERKSINCHVCLPESGLFYYYDDLQFRPLFLQIM